MTKKGVDFHLHLGGPPENIRTAKYINKMMDTLSDQVTYHGEISSNNKNEFYSAIDIFLFPSEYKNEAQPNVLFEANAFGVPVISLAIGCISSDVNCTNGFLFRNQSEFSDLAPELIEKLSQNKENLMLLKKTTLDRIKCDKEEAEKSHKQLISQLLSFAETYNK